MSAASTIPDAMAALCARLVAAELGRPLAVVDLMETEGAVALLDRAGTSAGISP